MSVRLEELVKAIKDAKRISKPRRFAQGYELIVKLRDVDIKQPENRFSELVVLPNPPPQKLLKVAVIADGDMAIKAREAGAGIVVTREVLEKVSGNKKEVKKLVREYDVFLAQADMMPLIGRLLGRHLGPRGKMPTPLPPSADVRAAIDRVGRAVRVRLRDQPQVACRIGVETQDPKQVAENAIAVLNFLLNRFKPQNIERVYVKLTMGSPVRVV